MILGYLVQIPPHWTQLNGAIKAITAANIALESDPSKARVTSTKSFRRWETAQSMSDRFKETSEGVAIAVNISECW